MNIPIDIEGEITNSEKAGHCVLVLDDYESTGGFVVYEWWNGSTGPNPNGAFDSWVQDMTALETFFAECGWLVDWRANMNGH